MPNVHVDLRDKETNKKLAAYMIDEGITRKTQALIKIITDYLDNRYKNIEKKEGGVEKDEEGRAF